jgi:restriction endonuclease S subunit
MGLEGDSAESLRPRAWKELPISEVFQFKQGVQVPVERQEFVRKAGQVRFIRIVDLTNRTEPWRFIADPGSMHHVTATDLFMVRYGCPGTMGIGFEGVVANNLFRLIPQRSVHSKFFYYYLSNQQEAIANISGSSTMPAINFGSFRNFVVFEPSVEEQQAIATALSDADAYIESLEQLITKKRQIKQGVMQEVLTGKRRLPGFEGAWVARTLGEVSTSTSGGTPSTKVEAYYDGDIPWVSISDMTKGGKLIFETERNLTPLGLAQSAAQMLPVGTVLYAMYASIGECSIAGVPLCSSQAILGIQPNKDLVSEFLYYTLSLLKPIIKSLGQQGTQSNLNAGMVRGFQLNLPSVAEQRAILGVLADMDGELDVLSNKLDKARHLKQAMMQQLLTGKIRLV